MATFTKAEHYGTFGSIGNDTLEVNSVAVDDRPPRLHIGRWTADGKHKRFSGFMSPAQAETLWGILDTMDLKK